MAERPVDTGETRVRSPSSVATKKVFLGWCDLDMALRSAAEKWELRAANGEISGVYGIPRGGLMVAVPLSHRLNVPLIFEPQPGCIIVDDVLETGKAMQAALDSLKAGVLSVDFWVWVSKNAVLTGNYGMYAPPDTWVVFPWEDWARADEDAKNYHERRYADG